MARPGGNPNLKPKPENMWKKGVSANPGGKSKKTLELEKKYKATKEELEELFMKCLAMKKEEIVAFLSRPEASMLELIYGGVVVKAAQKDHFAIQFLTDRVFGKIKDINLIQDNRQQIVYKTSVSESGSISCNVVDVEQDRETAMKTIEAYAYNSTEPAQ